MHPVTCFLACLVYFSLSFKYLSTPVESVNTSLGIIWHLWFQQVFARKLSPAPKVSSAVQTQPCTSWAPEWVEPLRFLVWWLAVWPSDLSSCNYSWTLFIDLNVAQYVFSIWQGPGELQFWDALTGWLVIESTASIGRSAVRTVFYITSVDKEERILDLYQNVFKTIF